MPSKQLAYMVAREQTVNRGIMSIEYPQWSLARIAMFEMIKELWLEQPGINQRKRKRVKPISFQEIHASKILRHSYEP